MKALCICIIEHTKKYGHVKLPIRLGLGTVQNLVDVEYVLVRKRRQV